VNLNKMVLLISLTAFLSTALTSALATFPSPPVGTTGNGTCGPTNYGGDCNSDSHGAWDAKANGITTIDQCIAKAKPCAMGNYVSFSVGWNDCSWYSDCDFKNLCADCSQPGPNCPGGNASGGHCPVYHPYESEVARVGPAPPAPPIVVKVSVDWNSPKITTSTAATVEVDVMPFLGEANWGGPYPKYLDALSNLGSDFVRFAPWFANPRVVVPELTPSDCTASQPATNWNSTYFDQVMADFMSGVCGEDAVNGECTHSVVQQLSTMPEYMYVGGDTSPLPSYPWNTTNPFDKYAAGGALVDTSCGQMARYFGRLVGWYTNGGFYDECGHWHPSGFKYKWWGLSVLNENEHNIQPGNGVAYTTCYDAVLLEVRKANADITLVGPEIVGGSWSWPYMEYFLNASNHANKQYPPVASYHWFGGYFANSTGEAVIQKWLHDYYDPAGIVQNIAKTINATKQETEVVLNEFIPFINDWCNCTGNEQICGGQVLPEKCPSFEEIATGGGATDSTLKKGVGANRATWSWNAAAAVFALGYASLAELGYKYVGADQLVGGAWPDNEPAVSCLDWQTGEPNAKYYAIQLLASTVGTSAPKTIVASNVTVVSGTMSQPQSPPPRDTSQPTPARFLEATFSSPSGKTASSSSPPPPPPSPLWVMPYTMNNTRGILLINLKGSTVDLELQGISKGTATVIEVATTGPDAQEPGYAMPQARAVSSTGALTLGPFAIAVISNM